MQVTIGVSRLQLTHIVIQQLLWSPEVVLQHTPPTFVYTGVFATRTLFPASLSPFSTSSDNVWAQQRLITPELEMIPVITAGFDGKIRMWNAHDGTRLGNLKVIITFAACTRSTTN